MDCGIYLSHISLELENKKLLKTKISVNFTQR